MEDAGKTDSQDTGSGHGGRRIKEDYVPRQAEALRLLRAGYSFNEIADELGFHDRSGARKAVFRALQSAVNEDATEVRRLHLNRIDARLKQLDNILANTPDKLEDRLDNGEIDSRRFEVLSTSYWKAFSEERALRTEASKLLGLDAPTKQEHTIEDKRPIDERFKSAVDELSERMKREQGDEDS